MADDTTVASLDSPILPPLQGLDPSSGATAGDANASAPVLPPLRTPGLYDPPDFSQAGKNSFGNPVVRAAVGFGNEMIGQVKGAADLADQIGSHPVETTKAIGSQLWEAAKHVAAHPIEALKKAGHSLSDLGKQAASSPEGLGATLAAAGLPGKPAKAAKQLAKEAERLERAKKLMVGTADPKTVQRVTGKKGGYTVTPKTGEANPPTGFSVALGKRGIEPKNIILGDKLAQRNIIDFAAANLKDLEGGKSLGTWHNKDAGQHELDLVKVFPENQARHAFKQAEKLNQKAVFDFGKGDVIDVKPWHEFIKSDEFHQRMDQMAQVGRDYMQSLYPKYGKKEWWDSPTITRIYGKENFEKMVGFIASTAPNREPKENLQVATEYMRRAIKGEPIIQPNWRVPEGTMSRNAGTQIGLEKTMAPNLKLVEQGRYSELQKEKVSDEHAAFMGDPTRGPFDRHHTRLTEKPSEHVYMSTQEGDSVTGKTHKQLVEQFQIGAKRAGKSLRDFSADVWTGIRETIKNTNELFGVKYRPGSIKGDSKSYDDFMKDLVDKKAKFLKISPQEMESRLRGGDANLLGLILATPIGAAAYAQWQKSQQQNGS